MIRNIHIKICGLTIPANREEMEDLPVDFLGFIFHPNSPRYAGKNNEAELQKLLSSSKFRTGVFVDALPGDVIRATGQLNLTHVQLHGNESPGYCRTIRSAGAEVIKSFPVHHGFDFSVCREYEGTAGFFLFDTKGAFPGGTGKKYDWQILEKYHLRVPFFLSGGIAPGDEEAIRRFSHPSFYGIDLNSGFEDSPGIKNPDKLLHFLQKL